VDQHDGGLLFVAVEPVKVADSSGVCGWHGRFLQRIHGMEFPLRDKM
jgi:hypothetical protein